MIQKYHIKNVQPIFVASVLRKGQMKMTVQQYLSMPRSEISSVRAALYTAEGSGLVTCARHAERVGLRIVTMIYEGIPGIGLAGAKLKALIGRLAQGEFDIIIAHMGDSLITIGAPASVGQGECGDE